jgi:hypothetical protein
MNGAQSPIRGRPDRRKAESADGKTLRRGALRPGLRENIQTLGWGGITPGSEEFDVGYVRKGRQAEKRGRPGT